MDKAEKRATEAYPVKNRYYIETNFVPTSKYDGDGFEYEVRKFEDENFESRIKFLEGYRAAEKDLEITVNDIKLIHKLLMESTENDLYRDSNAYYSQVLLMFNKIKDNE